MTAKPVPEHISDELLLEALKPFAALGQYLIDHGFITKPDDAGLWGFDNHTLTYGDFRAAAAALTELQHRREEGEPFCYVREWPASFDPQNGGEPASVDFSPVPKPGYEPLFKAAALGEHP